MNIYLIESHFNTQTMRYSHQFLTVSENENSAKETFEKEKFTLPPNARITKFDKRKTFFYDGTSFRGYEYVELINHPHVIDTEIYI